MVRELVPVLAIAVSGDALPSEAQREALNQGPVGRLGVVAAFASWLGAA
jgi:hypothetical protein